MSLRVLITSGPSYEPIDEVRRLTNFSTGELGTRLATGLQATGFDVTWLRGEGSTFPVPPGVPEIGRASCRERV